LAYAGAISRKFFDNPIDMKTSTTMNINRVVDENHAPHTTPILPPAAALAYRVEAIVRKGEPKAC